ncbi:MAG: fructosamine kinase family protein [Chromatiales bacterium]|nr:fructosamine kinase family protein [Chromatiales bacterium]
MPDWNQVAEKISLNSGELFTPKQITPAGGGCINSASSLSDGRTRYFVKFNSANLLTMFEAEMEGLNELAGSNTICVPKPICCGISEGEAYLVLEQLELAGSGDSNRAGTALAALHRTRANHFGWHRDNTIGSTPQSNRQHGDWINFWREERLGFQLNLAEQRGEKGALIDRGRRLLELFPALIDHNPQPSLLHGDLWAGNLSYQRNGEPVIYDPAVYYGDREADIAMTELFGGFGQAFYNAYNSAWPLDGGYRTRKTLYNLYHILNHLNLFGGGYGAQALRMTDQLLAELGH